jgi:hypothetical protein
VRSLVGITRSRLSTWSGGLSGRAARLVRGGVSHAHGAEGSQEPPRSGSEGRQPCLQDFAEMGGDLSKAWDLRHTMTEGADIRKS